MIRGLKLGWPALALLFCGLLRAHCANFTASLDRDTIALGETATLSLTFDGGQPGNVPTPQVPGLDISNAGNSTSFSMYVNGRMSSVVTVTFTVSAERPGEYVIPAMEADIGGQRIRTQPLTLTVTKPGAPSVSQINSGSQMAFMRLTLPDQKVYPGEMIAGQLQIFFRDDVQTYRDFQFTGTPAEGFTVGKMAQGTAERVRIGNRVYTLIPISIALTADKSGTLNVGPISASVVVVVAGENGQWGPFGGFFGGQPKQVTLATDPVNITSVPLPSANVPANFSGAVGNYTMSVSAGPTN
ncbi:MAG: BatD family protein, partial [Limisphaerales bacterium]